VIVLDIYYLSFRSYNYCFWSLLSNVNMIPDIT